jgi:hypothetical protein
VAQKPRAVEVAERLPPSVPSSPDLRYCGRPLLSYFVLVQRERESDFMPTDAGRQGGVSQARMMTEALLPRSINANDSY